MKNLKIFLLLPLILLTLSACGAKQPAEKVTNVPPPAPKPPVMETVKTENGVTTFKLSAKNFKFVMDGTESPDLRVKKGDKVHIEFTSTEGLHDWVVDEFDSATKKVKAGESTSIEFVADKTGTFEYYCSVGEHRTMGMKGNLIVE